MIWFVMVAVQNLFWGIVAVFAGGMADRFGNVKVIIGGTLLYALGQFAMVPLAHSGTTGKKTCRGSYLTTRSSSYADSFIFALGSSTCSRLVKGISESKVPGTVFPLSAKRQETFRKNLTSWVMKRYNPP